jgi:O-antigen biosynthesis protein
MEFKNYIEAIRLPRYGSLSQIIDEIEPNKKVLDVGCADGYLAKYLKNNEIYGIDYNPVVIEKVKQIYKDALAFDLNDINNYEGDIFSDMQFDYIVFADVLEHVLYPNDVLNFFKKRINEGGKIIVSLPNIALWRVRLNLLFGRFDYTKYGVLDSTHLHLYTFKSAKELADKCELSVVKIFGAANILGPIVKWLPLFRKLFSIHVIMVLKNKKINE